MVKIGNDWDELLRDEWDKPYYRGLRSFLLDEYKNRTVYPPAEDIFTALKLTPYSKVKVVILGQDPYHEPGQAVGLAFSVPRGMKMPPSLENILKELSSDTGASRSVAPGGTPVRGIRSAADGTNEGADAHLGVAPGTTILRKLGKNTENAEIVQAFGAGDGENFEKSTGKEGVFQDSGARDGEKIGNNTNTAGNCEAAGLGDEKNLEKGGVLAPWAAQGVLMLNTVLTVRAHQAGAHRGAGWEQFTDRVIELLAARKTPMVFVLWGAQAISKKELIIKASAGGCSDTYIYAGNGINTGNADDQSRRHLLSEEHADGEQGAYPCGNADDQSRRHLISEEHADGEQGAYPCGNADDQLRRHLIITAPHPSPLSAYRGFFGGRYFSRCNYFLEDNGIEPIDWSLA